jgi:ribosomal protein S18 acetylase RimI-like enzyme
MFFAAPAPPGSEEPSPSEARFMPREPIITRQINPDDLPAVAAIHKAAYRVDHFSAHFSNPLLERMYAELCRENPYAMVATDSSGKVLGFVVGHFAEFMAQAKNKFVTDNYWAVTAVSLLNPMALIRKMIDKMKLAVNREHFTCQARMRLTSIAVSPKSQQKAVGKSLLDAFEDTLRREKIFVYGLSVKENNLPAVRFYQKNGFSVERRTGDGAIYYLKTLGTEGPPEGRSAGINTVLQ